VLAIASKDVQPKDAGYGRNDEHDLILDGHLAFLDPPKDTAATASAGSSRTGCP
jgi:Mg2+-importing ATPase